MLTPSAHVCMLGKTVIFCYKTCILICQFNSDQIQSPTKSDSPSQVSKMVFSKTLTYHQIYDRKFKYYMSTLYFALFQMHENPPSTTMQR